MVFRMIYNVINGSLKEREESAGLGPYTWVSRVGLFDIDYNFHMNNAAYFRNMEMARYEWCGNNGLAKLMLKKRWKFFVGGQSIRYRHAIPPFKKYKVICTLKCTDEKWMYMEHIFTNMPETKVYAYATVRAIVVGPKGKVPPVDVLKGLQVEENVIQQMETDPSSAAFVEWDNQAGEASASLKPSLK